MGYERLKKSSMFFGLICLDVETHFTQRNPQKKKKILENVFTTIFILRVQ